jgi:hypothetical protein
MQCPLCQRGGKAERRPQNVPIFQAIVLVGPLGLLLIEPSLLLYRAGERIRAAALARF